MTALTAAAAMATVIIEPENLSRMMVSFCLAVCYCNEILRMNPNCPLWAWPSVSRFGLWGKDRFAWRICGNVSSCALHLGRWHATSQVAI